MLIDQSIRLDISVINRARMLGFVGGIEGYVYGQWKWGEGRQ